MFKVTIRIFILGDKSYSTNPTMKEKYDIHIPSITQAKLIDFLNKI